MKKLIYTFAVLFGLASMSYAQDLSHIAIAGDKAELMTSKVEGEYTFTMPQQTSKEKVTKSAGYYTDIFTVAYDDESKEATINLVQNTSKGRYVIARFLASCDVQRLKVGDEEIAIHDFVENYLQ